MIESDKKLKTAYDKIWNNYLGEHQDLSASIQKRLSDRRDYYDFIRNLIEGNTESLVLEVGCGTGIDLNIVAHENRSARLMGCDISTASMAYTSIVKKYFQCKVSGFVADTRNLPLKEETFDVVYSQGLVEHFVDPMDIIREQLRVIRKGGILIINVPQKFAGYTLMKNRQIKKGEWKLGWERSFSYGDLKRVAEIFNLREMGVIGYQYWKSWKEPVFILKDLYDKFHRRNRLKKLSLFVALKKINDHFWKRLEKKWGHYFLQNIVIAFRKPR